MSLSKRAIWSRKKFARSSSVAEFEEISAILRMQLLELLEEEKDWSLIFDDLLSYCSIRRYWAFLYVTKRKVLAHRRSVISHKGEEILSMHSLHVPLT